MRSGPIGLVSAVGLALMAVAGCGSNGSAAGTGGSSASGGTVGSGGSSGSGGAVTNLGASTALNALTSPDVSQLCKDTYSYFGKNIPMATACKYKGLAYATSSSAPSDSQFQQVCKEHEAT